jgi:periplasmic divalent cation tolerance protein
MTHAVLVLTTVPADATAEAIARALVEERLAACVNVTAPMTSLYHWHGTIERDQECQLVIKTTEDRVAAIEQRVKALHPYELPEFLVIATDGGSAAYLDWITNETHPARGLTDPPDGTGANSGRTR